MTPQTRIKRPIQVSFIHLSKMSISQDFRSLEQALSDCSRKDFDCPRDLTTKLKALSDEINELGVQVLPYVKQQHNSIYFNHFATLLESPYIIEYIPERLGVSTLEIGDNKHYNHNFGDECFSSLLGSYKMTDRFVPKCTITDKCWEFMTQDGTAGYFITHQLLFFIMAEHTGCINKIEEEFLRKTDNSVRDVEQKLCANIYSEAIMQEEDGEVQTLEQDLFIEQSTVVFTNVVTVTVALFV